MSATWFLVSNLKFEHSIFRIVLALVMDQKWAVEECVWEVVAG
jgi:hypothetical protein